jgi:hypothetical protein
MSRFSLPAVSAHFKKPNGQPIRPLQSDERLRRPLDWKLMSRRRGLRPRLLATVVRSQRPVRCSPLNGMTFGRRG